MSSLYTSRLFLFFDFLLFLYVYIFSKATLLNKHIVNKIRTRGVERVMSCALVPDLQYPRMQIPFGFAFWCDLKLSASSLPSTLTAATAAQAQTSPYLVCCYL